jgi:hypothetical protein
MGAAEHRVMRAGGVGEDERKHHTVLVRAPGNDFPGAYSFIFVSAFLL